MSQIERERCLIEVVSVVKAEIPILPAAFQRASLSGFFLGSLQVQRVPPTVLICRRNASRRLQIGNKCECKWLFPQRHIGPHLPSESECFYFCCPKSPVSFHQSLHCEKCWWITKRTVSGIRIRTHSSQVPLLPLTVFSRCLHRVCWHQLLMSDHNI